MLQKTAAFPGATEVIQLDGLRVEYPYGFGLARASNTTPVVVLRFEPMTKQPRSHQIRIPAGSAFGQTGCELPF